MYCAAISNSTASGSNTKIITIITQRTASSNILRSATSPYTNSAIYLIGPTSASSFLYSCSSPNFVCVSSSISALADFTLANCSSINASMFGAPVPNFSRSLFISVFDCVMLSSATLLSLAISLRAAITVGELADSCSLVNHLARSCCLTSFQSPIFSAVFLPNTPSALAPIICCAFLTSPLST